MADAECRPQEVGHSRRRKGTLAHRKDAIRTQPSGPTVLVTKGDSVCVATKGNREPSNEGCNVAGREYVTVTMPSALLAHQQCQFTMLDLA